MSILVVDDEADLRIMLSELLTDEGYTVAQVANGREALAHLQATTALPHLILLDLMMPIMDGWAFLHVRQGDPLVRAIPVVVISAACNIAASVAALNVQETLTKPIDVDDFLIVVERYCARATTP
jgi:CheY-like chemotaxis protein